MRAERAEAPFLLPAEAAPALGRPALAKSEKSEIRPPAQTGRDHAAPLGKSMGKGARADRAADASKATGRDKEERPSFARPDEKRSQEKSAAVAAESHVSETKDAEARAVRAAAGDEGGERNAALGEDRREDRSPEDRSREDRNSEAAELREYVGAGGLGLAFLANIQDAPSAAGALEFGGPGIEEVASDTAQEDVTAEIAARIDVDIAVEFATAGPAKTNEGAQSSAEGSHQGHSDTVALRGEARPVAAAAQGRGSEDALGEAKSLALAADLPEALAKVPPGVAVFSQARETGASVGEASGPREPLPAEAAAERAPGQDFGGAGGELPAAQRLETMAGPQGPRAGRGHETSGVTMRGEAAGAGPAVSAWDTERLAEDVAETGESEDRNSEGALYLEFSKRAPGSRVESGLGKDTGEPWRTLEDNAAEWRGPEIRAGGLGSREAADRDASAGGGDTKRERREESAAAAEDSAGFEGDFPASLGASSFLASGEEASEMARGPLARLPVDSKSVWSGVAENPAVAPGSRRASAMAPSANSQLGLEGGSPVRSIRIRLPIVDGVAGGSIQIDLSRRGHGLEVRLAGSNQDLQRAVTSSIDSLVRKLAADSWSPTGASATPVAASTETRALALGGAAVLADSAAGDSRGSQARGDQSPAGAPFVTDPDGRSQYGGGQGAADDGRGQTGPGGERRQGSRSLGSAATTTWHGIWDRLGSPGGDPDPVTETQ